MTVCARLPRVWLVIAMVIFGSGNAGCTDRWNTRSPERDFVAFILNERTAQIVVASDNTGNRSDACEPLVNGAQVAGKMALVERGTCTFVVKGKNAQNAGAVGVLVVNSAPTGVASMAGNDPSITIPSGMISLETGSAIKC